MAGEATIANSRAIIKEQYTQSKVYWVAFKDNPEIASVKKDTNFVGDPKAVAIQIEAPAGAGTDIASAQAAANPGAYKKFQVSRIEDFAIARIKGQTLRAAVADKGALLDLWRREIDGALLQNTRSAAISFWRAGTGSRARIASTANVATNNVALAEPADITGFYTKMDVVASAADGGALRNAGASEKIAKVDRILGTITSTSAAWNTVIAAIAANDFLYRKSDALNGGSTNLVMTGVQGWVPDTVTATLFWGLDRTEDNVRLGGQSQDGAGASMQEAILDGLSKLEIDGPGENDSDAVIWMHPKAKTNLIKELQGKVTINRVEKPVPGSTGKVGFKETTFETSMGTARVMTSINVPIDRCFVTKWNTWQLDSLGPCPHILNDDSNEFLRMAADDAYEVRVGYYGNITNEAPSGTVNIRNFGR